MITRMECPKCQYPLEAILDSSGSQEKDYVEVKFSCCNGHKFSARVTVEDLKEAVTHGSYANYRQVT